MLEQWHVSCTPLVYFWCMVDGPMPWEALGSQNWCWSVIPPQKIDSILLQSSNCQWEFPDPKMELPTIYKAYFSGLWFRGHAPKIWRWNWLRNYVFYSFWVGTMYTSHFVHGIVESSAGHWNLPIGCMCCDERLGQHEASLEVSVVVRNIFQNVQVVHLNCLRW